MHLKNQPPVFVPEQYRAELEKLSKAALMDMVWDFAAQTVGVEPHLCINSTMYEVRSRAEIILHWRKREQNAKHDAGIISSEQV